jgi:hypothetical protein
MADHERERIERLTAEIRAGWSEGEEYARRHGLTGHHFGRVPASRWRVPRARDPMRERRSRAEEE